MNAAAPSIASAKSQVAGQQGVSSGDIVITGITCTGKERVGDRIIEKYHIDYQIIQRGTGGSPANYPLDKLKTLAQGNAYVSIVEATNALRAHFVMNGRLPANEEGRNAIAGGRLKEIDPLG